MNAKLIEMTEQEYEDYLDEIYPEKVSICGCIYSQGRILREIDPIAFNCGMSEIDVHWQCSECDTIYEYKNEAEECCE